MADMSDQKSEPATLTVAGAEVKLNGTPNDDLPDLTNRDPNHMNDHVKVLLSIMYHLY